MTHTLFWLRGLCILGACLPVLFLSPVVAHAACTTYGPYTFDADNDADESAWTFVSDNGTDGLNPANTARAWSHDTNDTTSADVGPTSGQGGSPDGYVYTEASTPAAFNDTFTMTFNTTLDASTCNWQVQFYWNQRGDDNLATVTVQTNENSAGWVTRATYAENGPDVASAGTQVWNLESTNLTGLVSDASTEVRFLVTFPASGTEFHNDFGLDTITISEAPKTVTITGSVFASASTSIVGSISKGSGTFMIDHPLDPRNKLLFHSFVESPDVKNLYDGIVTLDEKGEATVVLPTYFLALNKDFRYLGTPVGEPMPDLYVKKEIRKKWFGLFGTPLFAISGGVPGGRVSWQVTGIRHDPYIEANPIIPEVEKTSATPIKKGECVLDVLCE